MREKIVIANWKMNGSAEANRLWAEEFLAKLGDLNCRTAVCAPFVYLSELVRLFKDTGVAVGAQTVSPRDQGAFTGEVSAAMLADIGMSLCLVGHSERRTLWGEDDESVAVQAENLVAHGIAPVVCVGETLAEREAGLTEAVVLRQLRTVLTRVPVAKLGAVAYEPVWAIGTGRTATPKPPRRRRCSTAAASSRTMPMNSSPSPTSTAASSAAPPSRLKISIPSARLPASIDFSL